MVFLLFVILVTIEGLLVSNDYSRVLQNIVKSPINLVNYFPIIILLYLFTKELVLLFNQNNPLLKFSVMKKGIVFIQDYHIWLAIFETQSTGKIQTSELKQLKHLKAFSLELDTKRRCVRVFLYSNSYKELEERIRNSKPILEVVLPDIDLISKVDIGKLLSEIKLIKIGKNYFLKENSELIFPQFVDFLDNFSPIFFRMILTCNFHEKTSFEENYDVENNVQWYFFHCYNQESFFKFINKLLFNPKKNAVESFLDIQELQKARLRYHTQKRPLFDFQEGLIHFQRGLSLLLSGSKQIVIEEKRSDPSLITTSCGTKSIFLLGTEKTSTSMGMNQICSELCNIPRHHKLEKEEQEKKCYQRANFCQKLLTNGNFSSILKNILNQGYETDKIHFIAELKTHLSYHQLICLLAHLTQSGKLEIPYRKLIDLIYILLKLNYEVQEAPDISKKTIYSLFSDIEAFKQILPSLAANQVKNGPTRI